MEEKRIIKGIWIPIEIWKMKQLDLVEKFLLAEIDSFMSSDKDCDILNATFAEKLGVSESKIVKSISKLKSLGLIMQTFFDGRKRHLKSLLINRLKGK